MGRSVCNLASLWCKLWKDSVCNMSVNPDVKQQVKDLAVVPYKYIQNLK